VVEAGAAAPPTAEADRPVVLSMRDIAKTFSGVRALDGVTLTVHEGEVAALLGENGAGKSTLMNVLAGVFADYDGQIDLAGKPASIHSPRDAQQLGIGMIHQELNLVPELSIADWGWLGPGAAFCLELPGQWPRS
jgi:ribose transport system ATP-binding protein